MLIQRTNEAQNLFIISSDNSEKLMDLISSAALLCQNSSHLKLDKGHFILSLSSLSSLCQHDVIKNKLCFLASPIKNGVYISIC